MVRHYGFLTGFCVMFLMLSGGAYGAASVRSGATARAGSLRTLGGGATASVKATVPATQPVSSVTASETGTSETSRMSHVSGLGTSKLSGKIDLPMAASSQAIAELRQAIQALRDDYDALGSQYSNLSDDVSSVSDTAYTARAAATNNANMLTAVRGDLSAAKAEIEDLKNNGAFDEARVLETVEGTLATKNYATHAELAATDVVARGAVQTNELSQKLSALNVADKNYVDEAVSGAIDAGMKDSRVQEIIDNSMADYYNRKQTNSAIIEATQDFVDKNYVDSQINTQVAAGLNGYATREYVDTAVATGMNEEQVNGIVTQVVNNKMQDYYTKEDINGADFVDSTYVSDQIDNQLSTRLGDYATRYYVDSQVNGIDTGLNETQVRSIMQEALGDLVDENRLQNEITLRLMGYATEGYVDDKFDNVGLDENRVNEIILGYDYRNYNQIAQMIADAAPNVQIKYEDGKLKYMNSSGQWVEIDIQGLNGQDADQIEMRNYSDVIQWRYKTGNDTSWKDLVDVSDLKGDKGDDGDPVELKVAKATEAGHSGDWLQYRVDNDTDPWHDIYDMSNIQGTPGCGLTVDTSDYVVSGETVGTTVTFYDCNGDEVDSFHIMNGSGGTVTEAQIIAALNNSSVFTALQNTVSGHTTSIGNINTAINDAVTGLAAAHTAAGNAQTAASNAQSTATNAWNKVSDLENTTAKGYIDTKIGSLGYDAYGDQYASVAAKIGTVGTKTVKAYVDDAVSGISTNIQVEPYNGDTYICKNGNTCNTPVGDYLGQWTKLSVNLSDYLKSSDAASTYAAKAVENKFGTMDGKSTVTAYVEDAISSVSPTIQIETVNGVTYICPTSNCSELPPDGEGWEQFSVDLSGYATTTALDGVSDRVGTTSTGQSAHTRIDELGDKFGTMDGKSTVTAYVEDQVEDLASETYVDDKIGNLGTDANGDQYASVAAKIGTAITSAGKTVAQYVEDKVGDVTPNIQIEKDDETGYYYFCKKNSCDTTPPIDFTNTDNWVQFDLNMNAYMQKAELPTELTKESSVNAIKSAVSNELGAKLNKAGISLTRVGGDIKISGGGIAEAYSVASVGDLMCNELIFEIDESASTSSQIVYKVSCDTDTTQENDD